MSCYVTFIESILTMSLHVEGVSLVSSSFIQNEVLQHSRNFRKKLSMAASLILNKLRIYIYFRARFNKYVRSSYKRPVNNFNLPWTHLKFARFCPPSHFTQHSTSVHRWSTGRPRFPGRIVEVNCTPFW